jgi:penicillin-binding protein 1C
MTRDKPFSLLALSVWRKHLWPLLRRPWLGLPLCLVLVLVLADRLLPLPLPSDDLARVVLAEDGTPLWHFADHDGVWRYPVSPDQMSPYYLEALLTYEDRWFYRHPGVNPLALGRAAWQNLSGGRVLSGGSTLSMQVARLLDLHARSFPGKLKQLWRTLQLEWHLSEAEILTLYLHRAPFGGTLQGVAAASWAYLGKSPRLSALGGSGRRWWFVDGQPIAETSADALFNQTFRRAGHYQLSVLDESGQIAKLSFSVQN